MRIVPLLLVTSLSALAPTASSQNFNLDYGEDASLGAFGVPSSAYGAAAAQPGTWVALTDGSPGQTAPPVTSNWYVANNLTDVTGAATSVSTFATVSSNTNSVGDFVFNNGQTFVDHEALMDDVADIGNAGLVPQPFMRIEYHGLQSGRYEVYTYAWAPDSSTFLTRVAADNAIGTNPQQSGGPWPGNHQQGVTYTLHTVDVCGDTITITGTSISGFGSINGVQLKRVGDPACFVDFCPGDGSQATACPCGNNGGAGRGCDNSAATGGAKLTGAGSPNPVDTVVLTSSGELATALSIFLQGDQNLAVPVVFGDGVRCVGGNLKRLYVKNASGGTVSAPGPGDPSITTQSTNLGDPIAPGSGAVRYYQVYYRDPDLSFCPNPPGNSWNITNGYQITWVP